MVSVDVRSINYYRTACKLKRQGEADQEVDDNTRLAQPGDILKQPGQGVEGCLLQKLLANRNMIALLYLQTFRQRHFHPQLKYKGIDGSVVITRNKAVVLLQVLANYQH